MDGRWVQKIKGGTNRELISKVMQNRHRDLRFGMNDLTNVKHLFSQFFKILSGCHFIEGSFPKKVIMEGILVAPGLRSGFEPG